MEETVNDWDIVSYSDGEEVYEGGWLPEVVVKPPPEKNNYGLLLLIAIGAYFVYKNK